MKKSTKTTTVKKYSNNNSLVRAKRAMKFRVETKRRDTLIGVDFPITLGLTQTAMLLNGVAVGTADYNRIGNQIFMKNIQLRLAIYNNVQNNACVEEFVRILLVYDRQCNGVAPTWNDVIASVNGGGTVSSDALSFKNFRNRKRFKVLRDYLVKLPAVGTSGVISTTKTLDPAQKDHIIEAYVPINKTTEFIANAGYTVADIGTGSLYLMTIAQNNTTANSCWNMHVAARLTFTDQ